MRGVQGSLMGVVEFHIVADEIQYLLKINGHMESESYFKKTFDFMAKMGLDIECKKLIYCRNFSLPCKIIFIE